MKGGHHHSCPLHDTFYATFFFSFGSLLFQNVPSSGDHWFGQAEQMCKPRMQHLPATTHTRHETQTSLLTASPLTDIPGPSLSAASMAAGQTDTTWQQDGEPHDTAPTDGALRRVLFAKQKGRFVFAYFCVCVCLVLVFIIKPPFPSIPRGTFFFLHRLQPGPNGMRTRTGHLAAPAGSPMVNAPLWALVTHR